MQKEQPLVSIIMAARDTAAYVGACLDSIIAQSYQNWELIVVNDHSKDGTEVIIADYAQKDNRIRLYHSPYQKLIPALKYGYQFVNGTLLNRMDSDDIMPKDKIETLVTHWLRYGKGHIIAGGTQHFVTEGKLGGGFIRYDAWLNKIAKTQTHYQEIYKECVIPSHCWMLHKDDFDVVGGFEPEVYPEDYDLCFRFYQNSLKVIGIDKVLHHWRDRANRISRTWESYQDNRYFDLKIRYFLQIDRNPNRDLVLWGAGKHGKDLAKILLAQKVSFHWVCENKNKIGHNVYGVFLEPVENLLQKTDPQIIIAVSGPDDQQEIKEQLSQMGKRPIKDYWFFL